MKLMAAGDQVLVAEFGDRIDEAVNDQVHALAAKIEEQQIPGIGEVVPTFRSLLIYYDSYQLSYREAADKIEELARNLKTEQKTKKRILKIPCCYGARFGPDLADMEQLTGMDRKEMIDIHSSVDYKVYMLGFLPGFAYLGGLDERIHEVAETEDQQGSCRDWRKPDRHLSYGFTGRLAADGRDPD